MDPKLTYGQNKQIGDKRRIKISPREIEDFFQHRCWLALFRTLARMQALAEARIRDPQTGNDDMRVLQGQLFVIDQILNAREDMLAVQQHDENKYLDMTEQKARETFERDVWDEQWLRNLWTECSGPITEEGTLKNA